MNIVLLIKDFAVGKKFDKNGMPNRSGGEAHGENHARELIRLGHHVTIMAKKKYWWTPSRELYKGLIDLVRLHAPFRWLEVMSRLMTTHCHTDALYIIGTPKFAAWAIIYAKLFHKPVTLALTGKAEIFDCACNYRTKLFSSCDHYIATTHEIYQGFVDSGHIASNKISIIPHGIDGLKYPYITAQEKAFNKEKLGLNKNDLVLLFCARVAPNKGIDLVLRIWPRIHQHYPQAKLYIVGGGESNLLQRAREVSQSCENSIVITGEVDDVSIYHGISDVYIFPSHHEGLPTSLLESMASGLPTVGSNIGGIDDLIVDHVTGYLAPCEDDDAFFKKVCELFDSPEERTRMGKNASHYVHHYCTYEVVSKEMELTVTNQRQEPIDMLANKPVDIASSIKE